MAELREIISQSWYNCDYEEVGEKQQKKMNEFLEDNRDFIQTFIQKVKFLLKEKLPKKRNHIANISGAYYETNEDQAYNQLLTEIEKIVEEL